MSARAQIKASRVDIDELEAQLAAPVAAQEPANSKSPMLDEFLQHAKDAGITALPITFDDAPPAQGARQPDEPLELAKIAELIVQRYAGKPDDFTTSIGDWEMRDDFGLPIFGSYLCIPLGDWRKYANRA